MKERSLEASGWASWYWLRRELKRAILEFVGSEKELEREAFRMGFGREANWKITRDEGLQKKIEKDIFVVTERQWATSGYAIRYLGPREQLRWPLDNQIWESQVVYVNKVRTFGVSCAIATGGQGSRRPGYELHTTC